MLHDLITTNHRKSGKREYDYNLPELDVVTMRIRYRVNGVLYPFKLKPMIFTTKLLGFL